MKHLHSDFTTSGNEPYVRDRSGSPCYLRLSVDADNHVTGAPLIEDDYDSGEEDRRSMAVIVWGIVLLALAVTGWGVWSMWACLTNAGPR